jgi:tetratricopeptide (TPR) repeat protein
LAQGGLEFADDQAALRWLEVERGNLLAAVCQAATTPDVPDEIVTQLAQALFGFFVVRSHWEDWVRVNQIALGVARRTGDLAAQARAHNDLGLARWRQDRYEEALACLQESLTLFGELGDRRGEAYSQGNLGIVQQWQGRYLEAAACYEESLVICRELGDRRGLATGLENLGTVHEIQAAMRRRWPACGRA